MNLSAPRRFEVGRKFMSSAWSWRSPGRIAAWIWVGLSFLAIEPQVLGDLLPHAPLIPTESDFARLSRVRSLLASSTREHPSTVRIVFYGQSITTYPWWFELEPLLRAAYPTVNFEVSNLAIPGFQDAYLERTAPTDLIPVEPDLLVMHAFGPGAAMLSLLRDYRAATGSEVILQQDFPIEKSALSENTNPKTISFDDQWPYRNYVSLPLAADGSGSCLARFREPWKDYCRTNGVDPASILAPDQFHPGLDSGHLLAEYIAAYLLPYGRKAEIDPSNCTTVQTLVLDPSKGWFNGQLVCDFTGRIIDLGIGQTLPDSIDVLIDNTKPSAHQELYANTRVSVTQNYAWPTLSRVSWQAPVQAEEWKFIPFDFSSDQEWFRFKVVGSVTGEDGIGTNTVRFVSKSGRVVIEDYDHWLARTVHFGYGRVPDGFYATWKTYVRGVDQVNAGTQPPSSRQTGWITLANGLSEETHRLVLTTKPGSEFPLRSLRVKSPAGKASISVITPPHLPVAGELVARTVAGQALLTWTLDPGWSLESSASMDSKAVWKSVPAARIQSGPAAHFLLLSDSDATSFYRLVRVGASN